MTEVSAFIKEKDDQLILNDPVAEDVMRVVADHNKRVGKENCRLIYEDLEQQERIKYFAARITQRGLNTNDAVIVLIGVDDVNGRPIVDHLMPGMDQMWQSFRDKGQKPFARGIVLRKEVEELLEFIDKDTSIILKEYNDIAVVVIDSGTADIFPGNVD